MLTKFRSYFLIGITAFGTEYSSFLLLYAMTDSLIFSQSFSFLLGLIISFLGNRNITFSIKKVDSYALSAKTQFMRYAILAACNLLLSNALIYVLVEPVDLAPVLAKVIVMALVVAWNYLIFNKYIFKRK